MKKIAQTVIVLCCVGIIGILTVFLLRHFTQDKTDKTKTVYIALAGPMSGVNQEEGKAMLRGATMAYNKVKKEGNILKNKKVEIISYDDQNSQTAVEIASDIVNDTDKKSLLVLGHYTSDSSAAAGPIYQSNGIPAITGSAAVDSAIMGNKWFFRTIPGEHAMTEFIAYNMKRLQRFAGGTKKQVSLIYDKNFYETTAEQFKKIAENISDELRVWSFENKSNKDLAFKKIIAEIRAEQSVGPIFFATESRDCSRLISMLKYPGTNYLVIGTSSLAVPTFIQQFEKKQLHEQESLRDYTNETFAVSPFISYLADQPDALVFREKFLHQYHKEPTWVAAAYYDAMLVALNAVEQAELLGNSIREDRRRVRNALNRFNEKDVAVQGITGDIYFDENGNNTSLPLSLGIWFDHTFLPFYQQYQKQDQQQVLGNYTDEDEDPYIASFRVVYTGVDINLIQNIDVDQGTFTADFYLWFRFQGVLDDTAITFLNAQHPVNLGKPIIEQRTRFSTVRAYRVIADLKIDSTKAFYPLDRHTLRISFRHNKETRDKLIYVPDVIGVNGAVGKINRGENMLEKIPDWEVLEISSRQKIESIQDNKNNNKKNISYSKIDTEITVYRQARGMLLGKTFLPFLYILTVACLILFISPQRIYIRIFSLLSLLFLAVNIRILYTYLLPGQELAKYTFYLVVVLLLFSVLLSGVAYLAHRYKCLITARCILGNGIFLYLVIAIGGVTFLLHSHSYTPWSTEINSVIIQQESLTWRIAKKVQGTLDMLW
ncbi:MAG: ABC transporter substrate-binding protein [Candidatus Electrothrix sp. AW5]|nr:ABC transporter substrate-binding protein [Candidatus Electrothrix gigas]